MVFDITTAVGYGLVILALLLASFFTIRRLLDEIRGGESVGVDTALASIDGTEGGWRVTSALTYLVMLIAFAGFSSFLVIYAVGIQQARVNQQSQQQRKIDSLQTVINVLTASHPKKDTTVNKPTSNESGDE